jgi:hypoxanthine-DNA glycosylase
MSLSHGFPPVAAPGARVLILGSMPGQASLRAGQYYAHERNAFWRIMGDLIGAGPELPYAQRLERLTAAGIALWDVIAACERAGSLDADIVGHSVAPNDFAAFFAVHRNIAWVFFNGAAAETAFCRHVLLLLPGSSLRLARLPSTSPAHAALGYADKLAAWSAILDASCPAQ